MGMTKEEIINKEIRNGSFYDIAWTRECKESSATKKAGISVWKSTATVGQFGVEFENKSLVKDGDYRENHEKGAIPEWLKFEWVVKNLIGRYTKSGKEFLRLNKVENEFPHSVYYKEQNGVRTEITKAEAEMLCIASEFATKQNDSNCYTIPLEKLDSFARKH